MKFSEQWLREWVNPPIATAELCAQLTMAGLEVDAAEPVAAAFTGVVVGEVLSVAPHPDADRLRVCAVNAGEARPLNVVCGAANVAAGVRVPLARVGAKLPGGLEIKKSKLRGVESEGMLCSAKELGLAEKSEGLLLLPPDAPVGRDVRDYLHLNDVSLELGLTPNRGDCLSVQGVAREVAILNRLDVRVPPFAAVPAQITDSLEVELLASAACPRYLGRVVRDIDPRATTPLWMAERLRRSGVRGISAVVDITNYVLLELGQPMHAFDLDKLHGGIRVRMGEPGERLRLLDEREIALDGDTLVIADHRGAVAMAGIMGGADSAVTEATRHVFLESAFFSPYAISGRARRHGMHTDSSHRFERGVDPELPRRAMERATALLLEIAGGRAGPVIEAKHDEHLPRRAPIALRGARITRLLGMELPFEEVADILRRLGMRVIPGGEGWQVIPPPHRFDITIEADLIEELARVHGYDRLPARRTSATLVMGGQSEERIEESHLRQRLVDRGYQEAITYSFVEPKLQALFDPDRTPLTLLNPISADLAVMRTSLWPGLMQALTHNLNRQQTRVRLFESGSRFLTETEGLREEKMLAGLVYGTVEPEQWGLAKREVDFFDVKADVESLLAAGARGTAFQFTRGAHPALHPGQTAAIVVDGAHAGWLGSLHPSLTRELDLAGTPVLFELRLASIEAAAIPRFRELSKFPAIRRDLAIVLAETVTAEAVTQVIRQACGGLLQDLQLFDVYRGKGVDSGKKSLAAGLTLQDYSRTLTDGEIDVAVQAVLAALNHHFGATLRE